MHPFPYDRFQQEAVDHIRKGISVFVSAPTGSGKTVIAEVAVEEALKKGSRAIYTAPIKALSNQKFRDFHARYGERVGILTGDVTLNPNAPLLIMTTEIYRNSLFEGDDRFAHCRWVIFDEVHYLDDRERGTVWEEALLLTPRETEILALSATIPNAQQLAGWIEKIHGRPVRIVQENHRLVPLQFSFQCQDRLYGALDGLQKEGYRGVDSPTSRPQAFRMGRHRGGKHFFKKRSAGFIPRPEHHGRPNRADHLLRQIHSSGHLPCLYFTFSRKRVEDLAWEFAALGLASPDLKEKLLAQFDRLCRRYEISHERSAAGMRDLVAQGVAYHHAGLLPTLKEVVEQLFSSRLIQVIVTTETFALGVNMPARAVVLDTLMRRTDGPRTLLRVRDLSQMAGRAGRRGMDEKGFVYLRVNPWEVPYAQVVNLLQGRPEEVSSRFMLTYSTVLNLYRRIGQNLLPFYQKTLHAHQAPAFRQREAFQLIQRKLELLQKLGYAEQSEAAGSSGISRREVPPHSLPTPPLLQTSPGGRGVAISLVRGHFPAQGWRLTPKGEFAVTLSGYELFLSELFQARVLDSLGHVDLGILLLALVYEPRRGMPSVHLPHRIRGLAEQAQEILDRIHLEERRLRITPLTKSPSFNLSMGMERWIAGANFQKVVEMTDAAEGEMIRTLRMTVQLVRALAASRAAGPGLKEKSSRLLTLINRDEVDAEAELRRSL